MKNKKRIPTIIGLFVLIFGVAAGIIAVQSKLFLRIGATGKNSPANVRLSDIATDSFAVSWVTDVPTTGFVKYGENDNDFAITATEQSPAAGYNHLVKITGLKALTPYFLKINSGGVDYDNNGVAWQTQTLDVPKIAVNPTLISGTVLTASSVPAPNVLVYISVASTTYATLTSQNGSWVIPVTEVLNETTTLLEISVQGGPEGIASAQIYPQSAKPVPTIILGQTYDFKSLPPSQSAETPEADINVPEQTARSSGFNVADSTQSAVTKPVTLTSIDNGEVITTAKPELIGTAPTGIKLQIAVESELMNGTVTVPTSGNWTWDVPKDLAPGNHKVTITWKDAAGITQSLVRNFVVSASEGPAFEATPSATPTKTPVSSPTPTPKVTGTPSPTPRFTATPTPTPRVTTTPTPTSRFSPTPTPRVSTTATPTAFPEPVSGALTPTILLSIMGVGLVALGFVFWKESNA